MSQTPSTPSVPPTGSARTGIVHRLSSIPTPVIFLASIAIALLLLWREGSLSDAGDALRHADILTFAAGILLYLAGLALLCARWDQIVKMVKGTSNLPRASEAFLTSVVINYAAPIGLAVPTRAALTKRALGLDAAETGAVALWEVAVDVLVLGIFSALWLLLGGWRADFLHNSSGGEQFAGIAIIVIGLMAAVAVAFFVARRKPALWAKVQSTTRTIATFPAKRPADAIVAVAITISYWIGQAAVMWLLLRALDISASAALVLGLISLPIVVGMLSPVPGGAGIREVIMIAVAKVHDVDSAPVLLAALTYRIALFASIPILYAGVRLWISKNPPAQMSDPDQTDAHQAAAT